MHRLPWRFGASACRRRWVAACLASSLLPWLRPAPALAVGFELTTPGARDSGRAGASVAGADSAMGLFYNPATMLAGSALTDTAVALHTGFTHLCYTQQTVIEDGAGGRSAGGALPEICSAAKTSVVPALASVLRFGTGKQRFAVSLGFYAPPAAGRNVHFGNPSTGTVDNSATSPLSPSRYMLMQEKVTQSFPTLGFAYQPHPQFRVGASFGWGITNFDFTTASYSRMVVSQSPMLTATSDVSTRVKGNDWFQPRIQVGVWGQPVKRVPLELGLSFTWTDDVSNKDSQLTLKNLRTDYAPTALVNLIGGLPQPAINATVKHVSVTVPQVSTLVGGVRYAKKLSKPVGRWGDRMSTELFDVELDGVVAFSQNVDKISVGLPDTSVTIPSPRPDLAPDQQLQLPRKIALQHHWQTQYALRAGGDYNVMPGFLAARLGYSFESDAVSAGYHQLDFLPIKRHGLYAGATVRIAQLIDVSVSYAYFVVPDVSNSVQNAQLRRSTSGMPAAGDNTVINAGRITQTASMLALELGMHL